MENPCNSRCCMLSVFIILFWCRWIGCSSLLCDVNNYAEDTAVAENIKTVLDNLVKASRQPAAFNISVVGQGINRTVYGLLQCRGDTTADMCFNCTEGAVQEIQGNRLCRSSLEANIWHTFCFLRYEIKNFTGALRFGNNIAPLDDVADAADPESFDNTKQKLLRNLVAKAISDPRTRYASGSTEDSFSTIYGLVQCWRDISMDDCEFCLYYNLGRLLGFAKGKTGGTVVDLNCIAQFEVYSFFAAPAIDDAPAPAPAPAPESSTLSLLPSGGSKKISNTVMAIVGGSAGGFVLLLLFLGGFLLLRTCRRNAISRGQHHQTRTSSPRQEEQEDLVNKHDNILFTAEELRLATNNYDDELKLGEGGFGSVYKGTLLNGQNVAVKKLSLSSSEAKDEFMNEIKLLMNVQHRSLVNLLGCCIEGSQKILVYEYLYNSSLDKFLFDPERKRNLNWRRRFTIILGVAKGLLYLHEDSNIKIIHRDIKAANILLDQNFQPKIADFGLAKLFSDAKSRILTRIAGTRGYMAPEYAMQGQLSIKADVYSFGILLMEIICGKSNNDIDSFDGQSILAKTWRLFQEGNICDIVDASVKLNCVEEQVMRFMHVGLLCTQAKADLRPPMSRILCMLSDASVTLPYPTIPAFVDFTSDTDSNTANGVTPYSMENI